MSAAPGKGRKAGVLMTGLFGSALAVVSFALPASAQDQNQGGGQGQGQGQGGGGRRGGGQGGGGFDPEQFRQRMQERLKERLAASDEEWKVIQPKIDKVMTLQRQSTSGRGMGMLFGGGRGGRGPGGGGPGGGGPGAGGPGGGGPGGGGGGFGGGPGGPQDDSPVAQKARDLQQSIDNNAGAEELKAKLAALREARAKAREQLTAAQGELKELLTAKQEAALVVMGLLE